MTESSIPATSQPNDWHLAPPAGQDDADQQAAVALARLRAVLLGPIQQELGRLGRLDRELTELGRRIGDDQAFAARVAEVFAEALQLRDDRDGAVQQALQPTLEQSLRGSIERNPKALADILYPVMGPAIRKAINNAIRGMFDDFNRILEHSLTPQAMAWRLQAWRTGEPFAKIALLHTLVYQVEQVFLVHAETGLLMAHATNGTAITQDPDIVSGMLTAIRDFVADAFTVAEEDGLSAMTYGDLQLLILTGPYAVLAAAIRGPYPEAVRHRLVHTIEDLHRRHATALRGYRGDSSQFPDLHGDLEACLMRQQSSAPRPGRGPRLALATLTFAILALVALLTLVGIQDWRRERAEAAVVAHLTAEPGYVVVAAQERDGVWQVQGLRDPLARPEAEVLADLWPGPTPGLASVPRRMANMITTWQPYYALDPALLKQRITQLLQPPAGVELGLEDEHLVISGQAPYEWVTQAATWAAAIPGLTVVDTSGLIATDPAAAELWESLRQRLQAEPGYVITEARQRPDGFVLSGFRDPLARPFAATVGAELLAALPVTVDWSPYLSIEGEIVKRRLDTAHTAYQIPASVHAKLRGDTLVLTGQADQRWVTATLADPDKVPGINRIEAGAVVPLDADHLAYNEVKARIEAYQFEFPSGRWEIDASKAFIATRDALAGDLQRLCELATALGQDCQIRVIGMTDNAGLPVYNLGLRQRRAEFIRDQLIAAGVPAANLMIGRQEEVDLPPDRLAVIRVPAIER